MELGVTRIGATATEAILEDFKAHKASGVREPAAAAAGGEAGTY
jgi:hypothetical protein